MSDNSLLANRNVHGIYIPVGLLIVGCFIVKKEWTPYAALVGAVLGAWKFYSQGKWFSHQQMLAYLRTWILIPTEPKKVLKPDVFQEFELKEKTIVSHNVAMYEQLSQPTSLPC
jgi:cytochrome-b5 reductase